MGNQEPHTRGDGHGYVPAMGHDRLLPLYDAFSWVVGVRFAHRRLVGQAGIGSGDRVLEIGTGTGNLALLVAARHPDAEVIGLDPDPLALTRARSKADRRGLRVRWDLGSATELPYPDGSVDRVLSSLMFHHLDEDAKRCALTEVRRVLKPGGRLHLMDAGGAGHDGRLTRFLYRSNPHLLANAGDGIPERMRAAGLPDAAQIERRGLISYFRATR